MAFLATLKARLKRNPAFAQLNKLRRRSKRIACNLAATLPCSSLTFGPPKGLHLSTRKYVEGCKSDPANPAAFRVFTERKEIVIPAPKLVLGTEKEFFLTPRTYRSEEAFLATLPWGRSYHHPYAIIAADDRLLVDMSSWWGERPEDHWLFDRLRLAPAHTLRGRTLQIGGGSWFFHFLFDWLPTLGLVEQAGMRLADFDHIVLENPGQPFAETVIDHLAIPRAKIVDPRVHPHLRCESLTAPSYPWDQGVWRSEFLRSAFAGLDGASPVSSKRIFISRKGARMRRIVNEGDLAPILAREGFVMLEIEKFSFAEQIAIFRQAEIVAGPAGAAFTLLSFCKPGTKVLSMMSDADTSGGALMKVWDMVCKLNGLDFYLLCTPSPNLEVTADTPFFSADLKPDVALFEQIAAAMLA
jgi:capsular polysaccharide biosynthesis protein